MFNINVDEQEARELLEQAINQRVDELAREKFFMTYKELAEYLNLSKPTIEEILINNGMKYYMVGSTYRFKKSDVDEFMEKITSQMDIHNNDFKQINVKKLMEVQNG
ncbi:MULTISPECIES: helix-turn-helix domain-containing protein [Bacillota]|uniref:helix-turn-helix domain-containing protein n=1 Tax=Bacillota TaxID=1239 RepID=UPI000299315D|nr:MULTISPECIES: helix-turn-helix domain-containing protein [Bacillota]MDU4493556.1 helix-turn-helix domain-containing protein [Staphylococcus warneri]EKS31543.1 excisionase family DNA binding domain-containing protein [Staphylococcus epidermidis BVS058A4]MBF8102768.1 helix-turn-helix domain-containing protein [Staphylococcus epidermidis]MBM6163542.1 helix-turn-helix domain-containing protein [Staphylococcus epidermidis]MBM6165673.1 helix-turn-helix domain-containing protein [Staphylococcus ep